MKITIHNKSARGLVFRGRMIVPGQTSEPIEIDADGATRAARLDDLGYATVEILDEPEAELPKHAKRGRKPAAAQVPDGTSETGDGFAVGVTVGDSRPDFLDG